MITVLAPNPSIDKLFVVDELIHNAIHRPRQQIAVPGGKGLNVARVAHRLGAEVRVLGMAAGASGHWLADALAAAGVQARWMWHRGETRSCLSVSHGPGTQLTEFYEAGPRVTDQAWQEYAEMVAHDVAPGDRVVACGSLPDGAPDDGYLSLLAGSGSWTAVDTSGEPLRQAMAGEVSLLKVNAAEAAQTLGSDVADGLSLVGLATALKERSSPATVVVVTGGVAGAVLIDVDGATLLAGLPVTGAFPVGSGDALLAGLLVAKEDDRGWPEALRLGTAVAVANAEVPGAGRFHLERIPELLDAVDIESGDHR
jgi:1-phosphofructokinase family hexose kinase